MAMAPPPTNIMSFHLLFVAIFAMAATSAAGGLSQSTAPPSSGEALAFLHGRCANTTNATACYNSLLPFAGSFNGSQVKISTAAAAVAFAQVKIFLGEVRRIQAAGGLGTGRRGDFALGDCIDELEQSVDKEMETLSWFRVLDSGSNFSKEKRQFALYNVEMFVSSGGADGCLEDMIDAGDAALSSLVAKKVLTMARNCNQYQQIAFDLLLGIKL